MGLGEMKLGEMGLGEMGGHPVAYSATGTGRIFLNNYLSCCCEIDQCCCLLWLLSK